MFHAQADAFRISESIGNCIGHGTACSAAVTPPLPLCGAVLSRFVDPRLEESERVCVCALVLCRHAAIVQFFSQVLCVLALVALFKNASSDSAVLRLLLHSRAIVTIMRTCIEHPALLQIVSVVGDRHPLFSLCTCAHVVCDAYSYSICGHVFCAATHSRSASILINCGAISVLSELLSPALAGRQPDTVLLACTCLQKLASTPTSEDCAVSAAAALLQGSLISALAFHVAPPPISENSKVAKSKPLLSKIESAISQSTAPASVADAALVRASARASVGASPQQENVILTAVAAVSAVVRTWFIW